MTRPRVASPHYVTRDWCVPWLTMLLLALFVGLFLLALNLPGLPPLTPTVPSRAALIALGAASVRLVAAGQSWRLLTAPFMHGSLAHLAGNAVAFSFAGYQLERLVGRAWMFSIFAAGGLAGSAMSLLLLDPALITVGASGAIMAMLTALFFINLRLPVGRARTRNQFYVARLLIPALLPLASHDGGAQIDYGAHMGGCLLGAVLGLLLFGIWERHEMLPPWRPVAAVFAVAALASYCGAAMAAVGSWQSPLAERIMTPPGSIPDRELPHGLDEIAARAITLLGEYPDDPRSHYFAAIAQLRRRDPGDATAELRIALSRIDATKQALYPHLASDTRVLLASALLDYGRRDAAIEAAAPACRAGMGQGPTGPLADRLRRLDICR